MLKDEIIGNVILYLRQLWKFIIKNQELMLIKMSNDNSYKNDVLLSRTLRSIGI